MINYSVYMMPNPQKPELAPKAYAKPQAKEKMSFRSFIRHIADHGGYTRGKVKGVLTDMCGCLVEMLLEGKKVSLDDLGEFWISFTSEGAKSCEDFTTDNIKSVNIVFSPGPDFENLIGKAEFMAVASRAAQTATLKAEKTGAKTVNLEEAKKKKKNSESNKEEPTEPTGGGGTTPTEPGSEL